MLSSYIRKHSSILLPRLGRLRQHAPMSMVPSRPYARVSKLDELPRISIVTPSYNQAAFIDETIKSVLDQEYPQLEYFIQDGDSRDGTIEILQRYSDQLFKWESHPDSGQSQAINFGFAKTTGEVMAWLNSDDLLLDGALDYVADYFNLHPEVDVVYGNRILIDENGQQIGRWILPAHSDDVLSWQDYIPQETLFWRRDIWEKTGGYVDESFRFAMDWDLLIRFREAGARFARLPRYLGAFRIHSHQKTSAAIKEIGLEEMDRIRKRALGYVPSKNTIRVNTWPYLIRHGFTDLWWKIRGCLVL